MVPNEGRIATGKSQKDSDVSKMKRKMQGNSIGKLRICQKIDGCIPVKVKYQKGRNQQEIEMY